MNVTFVANDPHEKAGPHLEAVLSAGTDQLAIACGFLTDGGADFDDEALAYAGQVHALLTNSVPEGRVTQNQMCL